MTCIVLLVRHGETDWNRDLRWQGHADPPLNELGRSQAGELAAQLAGVPVAAIYSSDLRRATETAAIVAAAKGLDVRALASLREVDVGSWSGLTQAETEERYPDGLRRWRDGIHGWDGGETIEAMAGRVVAAVREIGAAHPGEHVLVVTHGGPIRAVHAAAAGTSWAEQRRLERVVANCAVSRIAVGSRTLRRLD